MLLQLQSKGSKDLSTTVLEAVVSDIAISEGPDLRMAAKAVDSEHKPPPDMTKCSLPHLSSYVAKTLFAQGLLQTSQSSSSLKLPTNTGNAELCPTTSFRIGIKSTTHSAINVGSDKQDWLALSHLIASHRPAHYHHSYASW